LCETAMMAAFTSDRGRVELQDLEAAIEELRWMEFSERPKGITDGAAEATANTGRFRRGPGLYVGPAEGKNEERLERPVMAKLVVVADGKTVGELPLYMGRTVIGRTPDNDLQIDSRFVSRHHCQIVTRADTCVVEDLNSTNGIVVKSRRVRRHNLNDGDVITIGRHDLIYLDQRGERAAATGDHSAAAVAEALRDRDRGETEGVAVDDEDLPAHGSTQRL